MDISNRQDEKLDLSESKHDHNLVNSNCNGLASDLRKLQLSYAAYSRQRIEGARKYALRAGKCLTVSVCKLSYWLSFAIFSFGLNLGMLIMAIGL